MWNWLITWLMSEWYHFKKSHHPDTMWFGLFAAAHRGSAYVSQDLRSRMSFYVDGGRVVIEYAPLAA